MSASSNVMDRIRAHFDAPGRRSFEVPEWDLTIYTDPLTVRERSQIFKAADQGGLEYQVETLILKAKDADGKPIFGPHDRITLLSKADPAVVERAAGLIIAQDLIPNPNKEVDEIKKN